MKKSLAMLLSLTLCAGLFAGCSNSDSGTPSAEPTQTSSEPAKLSGNVATDGSTSMEKIIGSLGEAFTEMNPDVNFTYNPTGSGTGIQAVVDGTCDIGLSSRALKDTETGLTGTTVALDGIAVVVNPENPVADLSVEQIAALATGEITNWKDVGGADAPVVFIGREAGSGTRDGFESITGTSEKCVYSQELTSTGDVIATVAGNPNAIGYASLSAVGGTVKALTVGGVQPTEATVLDGSYAIQRPFVLVTKQGEALTAAAQAFFDYALSAEAAPIVAAAGAVPVAK